LSTLIPTPSPFGYEPKGEGSYFKECTLSPLATTSPIPFLVRRGRLPSISPPYQGGVRGGGVREK